MKKMIFLLASLIIVEGTIAYGQINETFDGSTFPPSGWTARSTSGSTIWNRITSNTKNSSSGAASSTSPAAGVTKNLTVSFNASSTVSTLTYFVSVSSLSSGTGATLIIQAGTDTNSMTTLRTVNLEDNTIFTANTYVQFTDNIDGTLASNQTGSVDLRSQNIAFVRWSHQKTTGTAASCRLEDVFIPNSSALPVELTSFAVIVRGNRVELIWKTATETNNNGFAVERKTINSGESILKYWSQIGYVTGNGTTNVPQSYSFIDNNVKGKVSYRLKQIDNDGEYEYHGNVEATVGLAADDFKLSQNYPNPFNPVTTVTFAVQNREHVNVTVYNVLGQSVATLFNGIANSNEIHDLRFDGKNLSSGTYFYILRSASRYEVRTMSLMK